MQVRYYFYNNFHKLTDKYVFLFVFWRYFNQKIAYSNERIDYVSYLYEEKNRQKRNTAQVKR